MFLIFFATFGRKMVEYELGKSLLIRWEIPDVFGIFLA